MLNSTEPCMVLCCKDVNTYFMISFRIWNDNPKDRSWKDCTNILWILWLCQCYFIFQPFFGENYNIPCLHPSCSSRTGDEEKVRRERVTWLKRSKVVPDVWWRPLGHVEALGVLGDADSAPGSHHRCLLCIRHVPPGRELDLLWCNIFLFCDVRHDWIRWFSG